MVKAAIFALGAALAGCASGALHVHRGVEPEDHYAYLVRALNADDEDRQDMWEEILEEPASEGATLRRALLRTVPGHSGWDLEQGEVELQHLLSQSPSYHVGPIARARLTDLRTLNSYRNEADALRRRLSQIADIEKQMDEERRAAPPNQNGGKSQ